MATATINVSTEQAQELKTIEAEWTAEAARLVEAAAEATARRAPGMLANSERLTQRAALLSELLAQVPADVLDPPPPPAWVADGIAIIPGEEWPYLQGEQDLWTSPAHEGLTADQLVMLGAVRLPAILRALGEQEEAHAASVAAAEDAAHAQEETDVTSDLEASDEQDVDDDQPEDEGQYELEPMPGLVSGD